MENQARRSCVKIRTMLAENFSEVVLSDVCKEKRKKKKA
jgi:hypothetical protein